MPRIYGHRGSRMRGPDNTLDSFRLAIEEGADGIETDVRRLADGGLVLHNAERIDERPTHDFTFDELASRTGVALARPEDLEPLARDAEVILEVKERGCEEQLVALAARLPSAVICSFDHRVVVELARLRRDRSASFRLGVTIAGRLVSGPSYVHELGAEWFFPASSFVDEETVAEFTAAGIAVVPWVLNEAHQWESAAKWGCHGFITDDPRAAATWRSSSGGRPA